MAQRLVHFATNRIWDRADAAFGSVCETPASRLWLGTVAVGVSADPMVEGPVSAPDVCGFDDFAAPPGRDGAAADVLAAWLAAARAADQDVVEGIVLTSDLFYPHAVLGSDLERWPRAGVVAVEMEVAALFVTASLHGAAAGAILAVDGNPLATADDDMSGYDPHRAVVTDAVDRMVKIALAALVA